MNLSARILNSFVNVNSFDYSTQFTCNQGDGPVNVYLQLVDLNKDLSSNYFNPPGRRYVPVSGATLTVTIPNIVTAPTNLNITKVCTQVPGDGSVWYFTILPGDNLVGTYTLTLSLTESSVATNGKMLNALAIAPNTASFC